MANKTSTRIPTTLAGSYVTFHGYDGRDYSAFCDRVSRGVAVITYPVFDASIKGRMVVAYVSDPSRIESR